MSSILCGDRDGTVVVNQWSDRFDWRKDGHHQPALRKFANQTATFGDQAQSILPRHDSCDTGGRILSNAVSKHDVRIQIPALQKFDQSHLARENRRLRPVGVVDLW